MLWLLDMKMRETKLRMSVDRASLELARAKHP